MVANSPSVQMHDVIGDPFPDDDEEERMRDESDPDVRISQELEDKMVEAKNEFYDGDKDNDNTEIET